MFWIAIFLAIASIFFLSWFFSKMIQKKKPPPGATAKQLLRGGLFGSGVLKDNDD